MGVMYGKREHLQRLRPYKLRACTEQLPDRWESGTQNHEGMAAVIATIEYLADLGRDHAPETRTRRQALVAAYDAMVQYERELTERLISGLLEIPGLTFYGIKDPAKFDQRTPTVAIRMEGYTRVNSPSTWASAASLLGMATITPLIWRSAWSAAERRHGAHRLGALQHGGGSR